VWGLRTAREDDGAVRWLAIANLKSQYKNIEGRDDMLKRLAAVFTGMFPSWSVILQDGLPPEIVAMPGYGAASCAIQIAAALLAMLLVLSHGYVSPGESVEIFVLATGGHEISQVNCREIARQTAPGCAGSWARPALSAGTVSSSTRRPTPTRGPSRR